MTPAPSRPDRVPIVLVGGFTVWGRDEAFGLKYWGGPGRDVQEDLRAQGHEVVTAAPGPFSSNWDRAAELYALLKGGRVDYGKAHAERCGHARFGRTCPGLLPGLGGPGQPRAHLVGHSMGGQTIRVLAHLLAEGDEAERRATPPAELSPLFQGGHPWILSLTSIATPHDGSTLTRKREGLTSAVRQLLALLEGLYFGSSVYDLKLDQWGLQRAEGERWSSYRNRVLASPLWLGTEDFSAADLSPEGARALNAWVHLPADAYGFSWSACKTRPGADGLQVPAPRMNVLWRPGARYMGAPRTALPGQLPLDPSWFPSDGVVNTRSMAGPSGAFVVPFAGEPRPGLWNHMGVLEGWDHGEVIGMGPEHGAEVLSFYRTWAGFLAGLPFRP